MSQYMVHIPTLGRIRGKYVHIKVNISHQNLIIRLWMVPTAINMMPLS